MRQSRRFTVSLKRLVVSCWGVFLVLVPLAIVGRESTWVGWVCGLGILATVLSAYALVLAGRVRG